jgi:hypothetical protein
MVSEGRLERYTFSLLMLLRAESDQLEKLKRPVKKFLFGRFNSEAGSSSEN